MIVLDASVLIDVLLRKADVAAIEPRIFSAGQSLHAPHLIDVEVAQVLRRCAVPAYQRRASATGS